MAQGGGARVLVCLLTRLEIRDQAFHCALGTGCHHSLSCRQGSHCTHRRAACDCPAEHRMLVLSYISLREPHDESRTSLLLPLTTPHSQVHLHFDRMLGGFGLSNHKTISFTFRIDSCKCRDDLTVACELAINTSSCARF